MSNLSVRLPDSLHNAVKELAEKDHVSINQFIAIAVAEKVSALTTEDYLEERAKRGNKKEFLRVLAKAKNNEPEQGDIIR